MNGLQVVRGAGEEGHQGAIYDAGFASSKTSQGRQGV